jgi:hypothetical protein
VPDAACFKARRLAKAVPTAATSADSRREAWLQAVVRRCAADVAPGRRQRRCRSTNECARHRAGPYMCSARPALGSALEEDSSQDRCRCDPIVVHGYSVVLDCSSGECQRSLSRPTFDPAPLIKSPPRTNWTRQLNQPETRSTAQATCGVDLREHHCGRERARLHATGKL